MRFAYCGYDFFHESLSSLIESGHNLIELFTWPTDNKYDFNTNVFRIAQSAKARITLSPITQSDLERLRQKGTDLIISAAYPYKIPEWRGLLKYGVNIHPSYLPTGRGPWPLPWVILKNLDSTGITVHELSSGWDAGDIVLQDRIAVSQRETLESLSLRSQMLARRLVTEFMGDIDKVWNARKPQDPGVYWPMPSKKDRTISWEMGVEEIDRISRAFSKFEAFVFIDGARHFVRKVDFWKEKHKFQPGAVALKGNREVVYAATDGFVALSSYIRADEA
jgi:methionyl-tRNA formyltransferase